jgi:hypothetical protein
MKAFLAVLLFCCAASAQIQHAELPHALTVEQCRADAYAWFATSIGHGVPYQTLDAEEDEMSVCSIHIDSDNPDRTQYMGTRLAIATEQHYRMAGFLKHHHMLDQFKQEDARGVR